MDVLSVLAFLLALGGLLLLFRAQTLHGMAFGLVLAFTAGLAGLSSPAREDALFRLILLGGALIVYALSYRCYSAVGRVMEWAAGAALAVSVAAVTVQGLPVSWLWDRNVTAAALVLLLPWLRHPLLWGLALTALAFTGSRGALLGLVAAFLWLGVRPRWYVWAALVLGGAVGLAFLRPETAAVRLEIWLDALRMFAQRPLTGWGIGAPVGDHWHAHNILLDALVNGGVFLGAAWALFLGGVALLIEGPPGSRARLGLAAFLLHGLVDCEIWTPALLIAAVNLALLVRYRESKNEDSECIDGGGAFALGAAPTA